jgi:hypothetical protein
MCALLGSFYSIICIQYVNIRDRDYNVWHLIADQIQDLPSTPLFRPQLV